MTAPEVPATNDPKCADCELREKMERKYDRAIGPCPSHAKPAEVPADEGILADELADAFAQFAVQSNPHGLSVGIDRSHELISALMPRIATELQKARAEVLEERAARYWATPATPGRAAIYQAVADDLERDARRIRADGAS